MAVREPRKGEIFEALVAVPTAKRVQWGVIVDGHPVLMAHVESTLVEDSGVHKIPKIPGLHKCWIQYMGEESFFGDGGDCFWKVINSESCALPAINRKEPSI